MLRRFTLLAAALAFCSALAAGGVALAQGEAGTAEEQSGKKEATMPAGPMLGAPIKPQPAGVAVVPEPVLASILAASAVIFLRRERR